MTRRAEVVGHDIGGGWLGLRQDLALDPEAHTPRVRRLPFHSIPLLAQSCVLCWNLSLTQIIAQMTGDVLDRPNRPCHRPCSCMQRSSSVKNRRRGRFNSVEKRRAVYAVTISRGNDRRLS